MWNLGQFYKRFIKLLSYHHSFTVIYRLIQKSISNVTDDKPFFKISTKWDKLPYLSFLKKKIALKVQLKFIRISIPFSTKQLKVYRTLSFFANYERYCDLKSATYGEKEKKNFLIELFALIYSLNLFKPTITLDCADVILIT